MNLSHQLLPTAAAAAANQLGDQMRNVDQRGGENDRDNAGLVDLQRQIGRASAVHPPAHHALGVLHRDAALALLDEHHADDDDQRGHQDRGEHHPTAAVQDALAFARDSGGDTREDHHRHAVTDAALGDQLTHPHHQRRARGHHQHDDDQGEDALVGDDFQAAALQQAAVGCQRHDAGGLQDGQRDRQITRVLRHLGLAGLAFFSQLFKPRNDHGEQLHDDARGDVGHHADREHGQLQQRAAGEQVDQRVDLRRRPRR